MKLYCPDFYPQFACLADRCPDTCCAGWMLPVDGESLERYRKAPPPLQALLREGVDWENGCFRRHEKGRCALLDARGLCRLILLGGEETLGWVCATHPRFFEDFGGVRLACLSLSCPAAVELLFAKTEPVRFVCEGEGAFESPAQEKAVLRALSVIEASAREEDFPGEPGMARLFERCSGRPAAALPDPRPEKVRLLGEAFSELEILTDEWRGLLEEIVQSGGTGAPLPQQTRLPLKNLLLCDLFHCLPAALEAGEALAGAKLCAACAFMVREAASVLWKRAGGPWRQEHLKDAMRLFAREFDHDSDNVEQMLDAMHAGFFRQKLFLQLAR